MRTDVSLLCPFSYVVHVTYTSFTPFTCVSPSNASAYNPRLARYIATRQKTISPYSLHVQRILLLLLKCDIKLWMNNYLESNDLIYLFSGKQQPVFVRSKFFKLAPQMRIVFFNKWRFTNCSFRYISSIKQWLVACVTGSLVVEKVLLLLLFEWIAGSEFCGRVTSEQVRCLLFRIIRNIFLKKGNSVLKQFREQRLALATDQWRCKFRCRLINADSPWWAAVPTWL